MAKSRQHWDHPGLINDMGLPFLRRQNAVRATHIMERWKKDFIPWQIDFPCASCYLSPFSVWPDCSGDVWRIRLIPHIRHMVMATDTALLITAAFMLAAVAGATMAVGAADAGDRARLRSGAARVPSRAGSSVSNAVVRRSRLRY